MFSRLRSLGLEELLGSGRWHLPHSVDAVGCNPRLRIFRMEVLASWGDVSPLTGSVLPPTMSHRQREDCRLKDEDKQQHYELAERLLSEENFPVASIAGAVAAVIAALAYGLAVAYADYAYGFAAAGIGIIVGLSMQFVGRGLSAKFGVLAAAYTIAGCIPG